jgi:hypothetical protein
VEISGDDSDVEIVNKNGELKIRMIPTKIMQGDKVSVTVFYENLNEIQASQGSKITSEDAVENGILNITSNEGSILNLKIEADILNAKTNSGGIINISGTAKTQDVLVNSGANFNGRNLKSEVTSVTTNAGGNADVYASKTVTATNRAGGNINVYGSPENRNTKNMLGGKINFR